MAYCFRYFRNVKYINMRIERNKSCCDNRKIKITNDGTEMCENCYEISAYIRPDKKEKVVKQKTVVQVSTPSKIKFEEYNLKLNSIYKDDCVAGLKKIPSNSIDLIVTDPPYGMEFRSNKRKVKHDTIANDDNLDWLPSLLIELKRVSKNDSHSYIFCSWHNIEIFCKEIKLAGFNIKNLLVWEKSSVGMGDLEGDYSPSYEIVIYCSNGQKKLNGKRDSNIVTVRRTSNELHPTQKPVNLIEYFILKSSNIGDVVLDPFMGSGTTAVAAIKTERNFLGFEIHNKYHKESLQRIKDIKSEPDMFSDVTELKQKEKEFNSQIKINL